MPFDDVVRAHTMMEKNEQVGKIVLTMEYECLDQTRQISITSPFLMILKIGSSLIR